MKHRGAALVVGLVILSALACNAPTTQGPVEIATEPGPTLPPPTAPAPTEAAEPGPEPLSPGPLIQPSDLVYLGAFRLLDAPGMPEIVGWGWSNWASAATYYPDGDPDGSDDGYPGSIFGTGHDQTIPPTAGARRCVLRETLRGVVMGETSLTSSRLSAILDDDTRCGA